MAKFKECDCIVIEYTSIYHMKSFVTQFSKDKNLNSNFIKKVSKLEPVKGEWCWFINKGRDLVTLQEFDQMCPVVKTNYISKQGTIIGTVEPFIDYLPMYIQNKMK